jgi:hypothetical protein
LPIEFGEHFLSGATAVNARSVDFIVAVCLEDIEDFAGFFSSVDSCS